MTEAAQTCDLSGRPLRNSMLQAGIAFRRRHQMTAGKSKKRRGGAAHSLTTAEARPDDAGLPNQDLL